ncbi:hypothetical protein FIP56_07630 [Francisella sp. LA112445]|nr:hypothetical protein FIP56_07630 [Francisella sp. LA112445]
MDTVDKFENVPVDDETVILSSNQVTIDKYDVLYQLLERDYILAESMIFVSEDVDKLTDDELKQLVINAVSVSKSEMTLTRNRNEHGFTFVNFNFVELD